MEGYAQIESDESRVSSDWSKYGKWFLVFIGVTVIDLILAVVLFGITHHWDADSWEHFGSGMGDFHNDTADTVILVALRFSVLLVFGLWAVRVGRIPDDDPNEIALKKKMLEEQKEKERKDKEEKDKANGDEEKSTHSGGSWNEPTGVPIKQPLLSLQDDERPGNSLQLNGEKLPKPGMKTVKILTRDEKVDRDKRINLKKNTLLMLMFIGTTVCQVVTGIKCVTYEFHHERAQGILMALAVLWINVEWWAIKKFVELMTREKGHLFMELHSHKLYYTPKLPGHACDFCRNRIKEAYRCKTCDFDLCVPCFKKKNRSRAEGALRGDKGASTEQQVTNKGYMLRALKLARPYWMLIAVAFLCLFINSGASLLLPNFQGKILDTVINSDRDQFLLDIKLYIALSVATGFFGGIRGLCFSMVGRHMSNQVRNTLYQSIIVQDIAFFDGVTTGELTSRLSNDASAMVAPMQTMLSTVLGNVISLVGGLVMCFFTSWRLSMLAITAIGPIIVITRTYARWSRKLNGEIWAALGDASSLAVQAIGNIRTVRAFGTEDEEIGKYLEAMGEALKKGILDSYAGAVTYAITNYLDLGTGVMILWYGGNVAMDNDPDLSVGNLITFQLYWNMINNSYQGLAGVLTDFTRAAGAAQRVMSLMDHLPDIDPRAGRVVKRAELKGEFKFDDVDYFYQMRPDQMVFKGLSLTIKAGKVCALVGRSGGGKSTIVHLLMRFYDPKAGRITLDGEDLTTLNLQSLHGHMGLVAQDTQLFALSIEQNIAYGVSEYTKEEMIEAAKKANAHDFIMTFEDGYDTRVGERGVRLSGGQKQRIAIARMLLRKPKLLFLDEATSALDTESEAQVQAALDTLITMGGCTIVLVAHRLSTVVNADQIVVIDKGKVVEHGNHDSLLAMGGTYARLVTRQLARTANTLQLDKTEVDEKKAKTIDVIDNLLDDNFSAKQTAKPQDMDVVDENAKVEEQSQPQQGSDKEEKQQPTAPATTKRRPG